MSTCLFLEGEQIENDCYSESKYKRVLLRKISVSPHPHYNSHPVPDVGDICVVLVTTNVTTMSELPIPTHLYRFQLTLNMEKQ